MIGIFAARELLQTISAAMTEFWHTLNFQGAWQAMDLRRRLTVWWRVVNGTDYWQAHLKEAE